MDIYRSSHLLPTTFLDLVAFPQTQQHFRCFNRRNLKRERPPWLPGREASWQREILLTSFSFFHVGFEFTRAAQLPRAEELGRPCRRLARLLPGNEWMLLAESTALSGTSEPKLWMTSR